MIRRLNTAIATTLAALAICAAMARADYPERPIHIVIPFPPGGASDTVLRPLAEVLAAALGQPVVVENVSGAVGTIGTAQVAAAAPDGYTLLLGLPGPTVTAPAMFSHLPYDPSADLAPVALLIVSPQLLSVHSSVAATTLPELVALAQARPGVLNFPSPGIGTMPHLLSEHLKAEADFEAVHVPYNGAGQAVLAIASGEVQFSFENAVTVLPQVREGNLRLIAIAGRERFEQAPDVNTTAEQGFPAVVGYYWNGIFAPAATPPEIVETLNAAINEAMQSPVMASVLPQLAATARPGSPADFAAFLAEERAKWIPFIETLELARQ